MALFWVGGSLFWVGGSGWENILGGWGWMGLSSSEYAGCTV